MSTKWTPDRREELALLINLIRECQNINSANGIVDRLQRMEIAADKLTRSDWVEPRASFTEFLTQLAQEDNQ